MKYPELFQLAKTMEPGLTEKEWGMFEPNLEMVQVKAGDLIYRIGEIPSTFHIVLSGFYRNYHLDHKGKEYIKAFHQRLNFLTPYAELIQGLPSKVNFECLEGGALLRWNFQQFHKLAESNVQWMKIYSKIAEDRFIQKEQREYEFLTLSASERYHKFLQEFPENAKRVPQYQIASYLGITPVALNRLIKTGSTTGAKPKKPTDK
ncbi:MAG: Crp/Fnr family transcriptional regulator [Bacteriovoracaceae bacterium]